ncbi:MAG: OmpA family protein [Polyangiales bacterium]
MSRALRCAEVLLVSCLLALVAGTPSARAESGRLNLHVELGAGAPVASYLAPPGHNDHTSMWGIAGFIGLDYEIAGPFALELIGGGGRFFETITYNPDTMSNNPSGVTMGLVGLGGRLRLLNDQRGYHNEEGGNRRGNLWIDGHLDFMKFASNQFGLDGAIGYEWSVARPVQIGVFLRGLIAFNGQGRSWVPDDNQYNAALFLGVNGSFELIQHERAEPVHEEPPLVPTPTDNDGDGILNEVDQCPEVPEDRDNYQDEDGCPDPDNDSDRVLDVDDRCPMEPEDLDGYEDQDGCPELDNDGDGVVDLEDRCPLQAGVIENRGCPDTDRDSDTVPDRADNCPDEPGPPENHGCAQQQLVVIQGDRLEILEKVYFRTNSHIIDRRSNALLDNVAAVLNAHPEIQMIRIEGHTDSRGNAQRNLALSQRRANSVMQYLIRRGRVARTRLTAQGFGPNQPIYPNATTEAEYEANRRVEFRIVNNQ